MKYSDYQKNIFREVLTGKENIAVISRAGVGKSFTILESFKFLPKNTKNIAIAFNRHIAKELKTKNQTNTEIYTFHSLGLRSIASKFGDVKVDNDKITHILYSLLEKKNYPMINEFKKAISIAKVSLNDSPEKIYNILDIYRIDCNPFTKEEFAKIVISALRKAKENVKVVDYDDMIWFPFIFDLQMGRYDNIFVDECQDLNYAQLNIVSKLRKSSSRAFLFLDDKQAIYSFRCAYINVIYNFIEKLNCKHMSLPMTYRCPKKVVEFVKPYVEDYVAFEENKEGEIIEIDRSDLFNHLEKDSVVLSRFNDELLKLYFELIKNKIPAYIKGKDIGDNIFYFIKKFKSKSDNIQKVKEKIIKKQTLVMSKNLPEKEENDLLDKLHLSIMLLNEAKDFGELRELVKTIFLDTEDKNKLLLSTIHSFKGGEKENVYVLDYTLIKSESQEEKNVNYVAYTRTKNKLFLVKG